MTRDRIVKVLKNLQFTSKTLRIPAEIIPDAQFEAAADQILLLMQPNNDTPPQLNKHDVSGWREFPAQKPKVGELTVMKFDDVGFFVQHYWEGLEEKYRPFQKLIFIQLPACR